MKIIIEDYLRRELGVDEAELTNDTTVRFEGPFGTFSVSFNPNGELLVIKESNSNLNRFEIHTESYNKIILR